LVIEEKLELAAITVESIKKALPIVLYGNQSEDLLA
jgi:hypothetical protein